MLSTLKVAAQSCAPVLARRTSQTSLLGPYDPTVASWTMPTRGSEAPQQPSSGRDAENWAAQMRWGRLGPLVLDNCAVH